MTGEIVPFAKKVFAAVLIIGLVVVVAYSIQVLLLAFAGILLAIFLRSAGMWLSEHAGLPINWCMAIVLISFTGIFFGSVWMFGVQIADKADQLFWAVSQAYTQIRQKLTQYHISGGLSPGGINLETPARAAASGALWTVGSMVMVVVIGVYLSIKPQLYTDLFLSFFDSPLRRKIERLLHALGSALRWWLAAQLIAMAAVGIITTTGLLLAGAPMAISLGVVSGLLTFVPYVGAIVSAVPAILLALTKSTDMAMYVVLVYLLAHVVEGYIVVPLIQHKFVYLPPALILAMQFVMDVFAGVIGVTFATPLMVVAMVLIKKLYFKQEWDEPADEPAAA